jgi:hypothetical protein
MGAVSSIASTINNASSNLLNLKLLPTSIFSSQRTTPKSSVSTSTKIGPNFSYALSG